MTSLTDYQASRERVEKLAAHCEEAASKHRERASEAGLGTPSTFWSDAARACENDADALRALLAGPPEPSVEEPVAWRVKDFADGWILCHTEAQARREAEGCGNLVQALYRSKTAPQPE